MATHPPRTSGESPQRSFHNPLKGYDFGRQNAEAPDLPTGCGLFAVRPRLRNGPHWQALLLSRLSWLSSSRPPFLGRSPDEGVIRSFSSRSKEVPTPAPLCGQFQPSPQRRDFHPLCATTASRSKRRVPVAPVRGPPSDRTPGLSPHRCVVFGRASLRRTGRAPLGASGSTGFWA